MKRIPNVFLDDGSINPEAQWVANGEGTPTRMLNGLACLVRGRRFFEYWEIQPGNEPESFVKTDTNEDGSVRGWAPVWMSDPAYRYHTAAWANLDTKTDGTYEFVGPRVQENSEGLSNHLLIPHTVEVLGMPPETPRDYEMLKKIMKSDSFTYKGIVWHHEDGRMAKVRKADL